MGMLGQEVAASSARAAATNTLSMITRLRTSSGCSIASRKRHGRPEGMADDVHRPIMADHIRSHCDRHLLHVPVAGPVVAAAMAGQIERVHVQPLFQIVPAIAVPGAGMGQRAMQQKNLAFDPVPNVVQ